MPSKTIRSCALLCGLTLVAGLHAAPLAASNYPQLPMLSAADVSQHCDAQINTARRQFLLIAKAKDSRPVLRAMNDLSVLIEDQSGIKDLLSNVSPDPALRDAAANCAVKYAPLQTDIFQNPQLYQRIKRSKAKDPIEASYRQDLLDVFEDSGVALPTVKRARIKVISAQLANLAKDFQRNIREDGSMVAFSKEQLAGVPTGVIEAAKTDPTGRLLISLAYPQYVPVMDNAKLASTREQLWRAKQNEGGEKNLALMDQITALRAELASLYGYPDYASFTLRRKMARTPHAVMDFLSNVRDQVFALEKTELAALRAFKSAQDQTPLEQTIVQRWDVNYLQTQLKKARYQVDQEALRQYFPTEAAVRFMLRLAETLYGLEFVETTAPTWHPDVRVFNLFAAGKQRFIGSVYLDLYPRPDKYNHAAVWPVRNASGLIGRTPIPVLVTNFNRQGLTQDELETLLHEFGHALHGLLSTARFNAQAGTAVKQDFVEAPSQMFEEWARRFEPLQFFAQVCGPQCPVLSQAQIDQLAQASKFGRGLRYTAQWSYAMLDMALTHARKDANVLAAWQRIQGQTSLGYVAGTKFPAGFGHLAGGYAAGYYGYMWSEVLALDMLSAFGDHLLNPAVGQRYRQIILAPGGQQAPDVLVETFLGRPANPAAFFKEINGQR